MNVVEPKELGLLFDKCNVAHLKKLSGSIDFKVSAST